MPVNAVKELKVEENDANRNSFVGYNEDAIYRVIEQGGTAYRDRNGSRVKDIFNDNFTSLSSSELASSLHKGKSELSSLGNFFGALDQIDSTSRQINRAQSNLLNDILGTESSEVEDNTFKLSRQILADKTAGINRQFGLETGADDAYNPDFPANSVSYTYTAPSVSANDNKDKVNSSMRAPNVAFPNNKDIEEYVSPFRSSTSNGGFGNSASTNSIGEDRLDSLRITTKYN